MTHLESVKFLCKVNLKLMACCIREPLQTAWLQLSHWRLIYSNLGEKQYKFEEILPIYKAVSDETDTGTFADFMEAFKTFDREGQGFISSAEMRHVLTSLGMYATDRMYAK